MRDVAALVSILEQRRAVDADGLETHAAQHLRRLGRLSQFEREFEQVSGFLAAVAVA